MDRHTSRPPSTIGIRPRIRPQVSSPGILMLSRVLPTAARAAFAPWTAASSSAITAATVRRPAFHLTSVTDAFAHLRVIEEPLASNSIVMECLNRNARRPKKANHGKRPCSHFRRRQKRLSRRNAAK